MAELIRAIKQEDEVGAWRQLARADVGSIINYQSAEELETPLFCASMKGYVEVVRNLLEKGAKIELKTKWGATALHAASERGKLPIVKILVAEKSPLNEQTQYGDTPAHLAVYRGYLKIVRFLVEAGADLFSRNSAGRTLLDEASVQENGKVVRYLENVLFGGDTKPTPWPTLHSRSPDPMVTTNLMQPGKSSLVQPQRSLPLPSPSQENQKVPVWRSHSSPARSQTDDRRRKEYVAATLQQNLHALSFDEVVHHPTVRLSWDSNLVDRPPNVQFSVEKWLERNNESVDTANSPDNNRPPSRPGHDKGGNISHEPGTESNQVHRTVRFAPSIIEGGHHGYGDGRAQERTKQTDDGSASSTTKQRDRRKYPANYGHVDNSQRVITDPNRKQRPTIVRFEPSEVEGDNRADTRMDRTSELTATGVHDRREYTRIADSGPDGHSDIPQRLTSNSNRAHRPTDVRFPPSHIGDGNRIRSELHLTNERVATSERRSGDHQTLPVRSGSDGICGSTSSPEVHGYRPDSEIMRAKSLERMVTELQCGLSYTQEELARVKSGLKEAKEQIDSVYTSQKDTRTHDQNERLYLKIKDTHK